MVSIFYILHLRITSFTTKYVCWVSLCDVTQRTSEWRFRPTSVRADFPDRGSEENRCAAHVLVSLASFIL